MDTPKRQQKQWCECVETNTCCVQCGNHILGGSMSNSPKRRRMAEGQEIVNSVEMLRKVLQIDENIGRGIPSDGDRMTKKMSEIEKGSATRMISFAMVAFDKICSIIFPGDAACLAKEVMLAFDHKDHLHNNDRLESNLVQLTLALPPKSLQRDVILAPIAASYDNECLRTIFGVGRKKATTSRQNFKLLKAGRQLEKNPVTIQHYNKESLETAIQFMFNDSNIQRTSRGGRKIEIEGKEVMFPMLVRKRIVRNISRDYEETFPERLQRISTTSFEKIVRMITHVDQYSKKAVDYVSGILLYDNLELIGRIIDTQEDNEALFIILNSLDAFIKSKYDRHIGSCSVSSPNFAFDKSNTMTLSCNICCAPFRVFDHLISNVNPCHHELLNDCKEKLQLYFGHRVRVANQRMHINDILKNLGDNEVMIVMDFKMKFEAMYYREKTIDFYGKKGLTWHGVQVYSRYSSTDKDKYDNLQPYHISYYDQIISTGGKQDWMVVLSCFEAVVMNIKRTMPNVTKVYVQSDNAKCYRSAFLVVGMALVAQHHNITIPRFIHTGVQDGKGPIDAHFATSNRHVVCYVNEGNNVITPYDLVKALKHGNGVNNSQVNLIHVDRTHLQSLMDANKEWIKEENIHHDAEITFSQDNNYLLAYDYSGFGEGRKHEIEIEDNEEFNGYEGVKTKTTINPKQHSFEQSDKEEGLHDDDISSETSHCDTVNSPDQELYFDDDTNSDQDDDEMNDYWQDEFDERKIGDISGCIVYGSQESKRMNVRMKTNNKNKSDQTTNDDSSLDVLSICQTCNKKFSDNSKLNSHVCHGLVGRSMNMTTYAMKFAYDLINQHQFRIVNFDQSEEQSTQYLMSLIQDKDDDITFQGGWACSKPQGHKYGRKYIDPFKKDIEEIFQVGVSNKNIRIGPGRMLNNLRRKYPGRLDLPSETEIRQAIGSMVSQQNKGQPPNLSSRRGVTGNYNDTILKIFRDSKGEIMPRHAWDEFQKIHPRLPSNQDDIEYPSKQQVTSKISSLRVKYRKEGKMP